jgi:hypothetical protein
LFYTRLTKQLNTAKTATPKPLFKKRHPEEDSDTSPLNSSASFEKDILKDL